MDRVACRRGGAVGAVAGDTQGVKNPLDCVGGRVTPIPPFACGTVVAVDPGTARSTYGKMDAHQPVLEGS